MTTTFENILTEITDLQQTIRGMKHDLLCDNPIVNRCDIVNTHKINLSDEINEKLNNHNVTDDIFNYVKTNTTIDDIIYSDEPSPVENNDENKTDEKDRSYDINYLGDPNDNRFTSSGITAFINSDLYVDEKYELKATITNFVFKHMINQNSIFIILNTLQIIWETSINSYIMDIFNPNHTLQLDKNDIKLVYRGGNTLTSILEQLLVSSPFILKKQMIETFENIMTKSDIDFTILLNPSKLNKEFDGYDELFKHISFITLGVISHISDLINANKIKIFENITEKHLKILLDEINLAECLKNISTNDSPYKNFKFTRIVFDNIYYQYDDFNEHEYEINHKIDKYNLGIFNVNPGSYHDNIHMIHNKNYTIIQKMLSGVFFKLRSPFLYKTYNQNVTHSQDHLIQKYSLTRLKINFKLYYVNDGKLSVIFIPAEFLDFSLTNNNISHENLSIVKNTLDDIHEKWKNIKEYDFFNDTSVIKLNSFTLTYYCTDICNILFLIPRYPWEHKKYLKLLKRLFLICQIDLLSYTTYDGKLKSKLSSDVNILQFIDDLQKLKSYKEKRVLCDTYNEKLCYERLFTYVNKLNETLQYSTDIIVKQSLSNFNKTIDEFFDVNNGIIRSSFSHLTTNDFIIDMSQNKIRL
jgi:hypothetical protein